MRLVASKAGAGGPPPNSTRILSALVLRVPPCLTPTSVPLPGTGAELGVRERSPETRIAHESQADKCHPVPDQRLGARSKVPVYTACAQILQTGLCSYVTVGYRGAQTSSSQISSHPGWGLGGPDMNAAFSTWPDQMGREEDTEGTQCLSLFPAT